MFSISRRPTITEIQDLYKSNKAKPSEVLQFFLNRSKEVDKKINSFYKLTEEIALQQVEQLDKILETEYLNDKSEENWNQLLQNKPLFGVPFAIKAIILVENEIFNASSKILDSYKAPYTSTVAKKMFEAGSILLGINNMDQFAMGSSGESSDYGVIRNPFDLERIPGGSSAGGVACVASGQVVFSLGTDTGGSIRQPAAFCDVIGLKPTYGLVSRWGVIPMANSFDQVGGITNTVDDNILVNKILAGKDSNDQTTINSTELVARLDKLITKRKNRRQINKITKTTKPLKIGIPKEFYMEGIDPQIAQALESLKQKLKTIGHTLVDIELPLTKYAVSVYYMTMSVEVASNLERIDGIRYANQQNEYKSLYFEHRGKYFGEEAKRRIMLGTYASSSGYYDAYYNHAQKVRELARREFEKAFTKCDLMLTPTTPEFPFKIGEKTQDPIKMYLSDVFTCGINPTRIPGLAIPLGLFEVKENLHQKDIEIAKSENKNIKVKIIICNNKNELFVQKLPTNSHWNLTINGSLQANENLEMALDRELKTQTGWKLDEVIDIIDIKETNESLEYTCLVKVEGANELESSVIAKDMELAWINESDLATLQENLNSYDYVLKAFEICHLSATQVKKENSKLPTGCQLLGPELSEDLLYELALEIELLVS